MYMNAFTYLYALWTCRTQFWFHVDCCQKKDQVEPALCVQSAKPRDLTGIEESIAIMYKCERVFGVCLPSRKVGLSSAELTRMGHFSLQCFVLNTHMFESRAPFYTDSRA